MNPHQWSLAKQSSFKVENDGPKVPKQAGNLNKHMCMYLHVFPYMCI